MTYVLYLSFQLMATKIKTNCIKLKKTYCAIHHIVKIFSVSLAIGYKQMQLKS